MQSVTVEQCLGNFAEQFERADLFYGHGTDNAGDEAVYLVFSALGLDYEDFGKQLDRPLSQEELARLEALARRRIEERIPVAYLVGEAWFAGMPFHVNEDVLIPRSPLAELILQNFAGLLPAPPARVLDLCTGSGCIGLACARQFPDSSVLLADISPAALVLARRNVLRHGLQERAVCLESDLFEQISGKFDLILSNPPYVSAEEVAELPPEYQREPVLGLLSQDDGLAIPLRILQAAPDHLEPGGVLIMEVGYSREALERRLPEVPLLWLEFEHGGEGVFMLTREQLLASRRHFTPP